jgi:H+-transporting ATPase
MISMRLALVPGPDLIFFIQGHGTNDLAVLSTADIGITVKTPCTVLRATADLMTTRTGLSPVLDAVRVSRQLFHRLRIGFIYAGALTVRTVLCFSLLSFVYKIDFPPFATILLAFATNIAILSLSVDRAVSGTKPARWDLTEILSRSTAYGVYLALSTFVQFIHVFGPSHVLPAA